MPLRMPLHTDCYHGSLSGKHGRKMVAAKKQKKKRKKWVIKEEPKFVWNFDHKNAVAVRDILGLSEASWAAARGVQRSGAGSEGVWFVDLGPAPAGGDRRGNAVCVKSPSTVASEIFGTLLARRLSIATPRCKLVPRHSDEGRAIVAALTKLDAQRAPHERTFERGLRKFLVVIQYVQGGCALDARSRHEAGGGAARFWDTVFGAGAAARGGAPACELGKRRCHDLGRLLAFDVLINNMDRLPCAWGNPGNPGNVMFGKDGGVISIDNMTSCIDPDLHAEGFGAYEETVRGLATTLAREPFREGWHCARVRALLRDGIPHGGWPGLGLDIGEARCRARTRKTHTPIARRTMLCDRCCVLLRSQTSALHIFIDHFVVSFRCVSLISLRRAPCTSSSASCAACATSARSRSRRSRRSTPRSTTWSAPRSRSTARSGPSPCDCFILRLLRCCAVGQSTEAQVCGGSLR